MKPAFLTLFLAAPGIALAHSGIHFNHGDWELACDNTGTCRAAGYQHGEGGSQRAHRPAQPRRQPRA